ncbi:hypothetical protein ACFLT9_00305 [Acidobacteriota bacterium]
MNLLKHLKYDPIEPLLLCGYDRVVFFTRRDLLGETMGDVSEFWRSKDAQRIIIRQKSDGRWEYPNPKERIRKKEHYDLLETYRQLGYLVEYFGFDRTHSSIRLAKEFVFKYQSGEGDIRGIYWNQYSPNYTAGFLELFLKAGYSDDEEILKGLEWLLSIRQDDGGWTIPIRTTKGKISTWSEDAPPVQPDRTKRYSYMVSGVVLRAFAHHLDYREREEVKKAAELVLSRIFRRDYYPDRGTPEFWTKFSFPYWYTDLIAVLDPISRLGFKPDHPKVAEGIQWFRDNQEENGTWKLRLLKGEKYEQPHWMALNICRLLKMFYLP